MKKGDIIQKEELLPIGSIVYRNGSSEESCHAYMKKAHPAVTYHIIPDDLNIGGKAVITDSTISTLKRAVVEWVIDNNEAAIRLEDGSHRIIEINNEPEWAVIVESVPSYQSSVANLTDEQLRESIEQLRNGRVPFEHKARKVREAPIPKIDKSDPLAVALNGMTPEKKAELMKKLGMTD